MTTTQGELQPAMWLRPEILDHGIVFLPPFLDADRPPTVARIYHFLTQLQKKDIVGLQLLRLKKWRKIAKSTFEFSESYADLLFDAFNSIHDTRAFSQAYKARLDEQQAVNCYRFALFLYIVVHRPPVPKVDYRSVSSIDDLKVLHGESENRAISFFGAHLDELLSLVSHGYTQNDDEVARITKQQLDHLGFLVAVTAGSSSQEVSSISSVCPLWDRDTGVDVSVDASDVSAWIRDVMVDHCSELFLPSSPGHYSFLVDEYRRTILLTDMDIRGSSLEIVNCRDCYIYVIAHCRFVSLLACSNCTVFVGCTSKELLMQDCDDMEVVSVTNCAAVVDSHNSNMFLACRQRSTCRGDYSGLFFAPYNTYYPLLGTHIRMADLEKIRDDGSKFDVFCDGTSGDLIEDGRAQTLPEGEFLPFTVPFDMDGDTRSNPFPLPSRYALALEEKQKAVAFLRQAIKNSEMDQEAQRKLQATIQAQFKEWLISTGNIRQIQDLMNMDLELRAHEDTPNMTQP